MARGLNKVKHKPFYSWAGLRVGCMQRTAWAVGGACGLGDLWGRRDSSSMGGGRGQLFVWKGSVYSDGDYATFEADTPLMLALAPRILPGPEQACP